MQPPGSPVPRVTVVVASYRRPDVLDLALRSALAQTYTDWQAIVVGDAARDGAAEVVARFGDPRLRHLDLAVGFGEQSGPNNVGVARTRSELVAFLNHDDLWFRDHLCVAVDTLDARGADLVFSPNLNVHAPDGPFRPESLGVTLDGLSHRGRYDPCQTDRATPASTWVVRRSLLEALGGWRPAHELAVEPSQDLLFRAYRRRARLVSTGVPTVITVASGTRAGSYRHGASAEHQWLAERLDEPGLRAFLVSLDASSAGPRPAGSGEELRHRARRALLSTAARAGLSPRVTHYRLRRRLGSGDYLRGLRALRGLDPDPVAPAGDAAWTIRRAEVLRSCDVPENGVIDFSRGGTGHRYTAAGWSSPEEWGVWNDGLRAELLLRSAAGGHAILSLRFHAHLDARHATQRVEVFVGGQPAERWIVSEPGPTTRELELHPEPGRATSVGLELPDAWTPDSPDSRRLAIGLEAATLRRA